MDPFVLLKFLGRAALPPASMVAGLLLALLLALFGWRKLARIVGILAVLQTVLLSVPAVADLLMEPLQRQARAAAQKAAPCCYDAIVVLGGGIAPAIPPWLPNPDLSSAADRLWHAARLYRQGVAAKVIVSGGDPLARYGGVPSSTESVAMTQFLTDLGVPGSAIVSEAQSTNTSDNIRLVRAMVQDKPVALVTSGYHMPRALRLAARNGLNAAAFPTDWYPPWQARAYWDNWMPSGDAQETSTRAIWEWLALAFDFRP
ncbi:MAG: YdcF family protein [Reyranella sp.]|uniref:YdcF family protein n=1 Tax=Reyranella sp. TaxID=1929291 RepID=UPI001AC7742E|nr:YdcF family protein [Reyranella sp.]MBN9087631.1 YdcF family protein [Reyranella sp.]